MADMQDYTQIKMIIGMIKTITEAMKSHQVSEAQIEDVRLTAQEINQSLYYFPVLKFQKEYDLTIEKDYMNFIEEIETLAEIWQQSIELREGEERDFRFWEIYEYFKYVAEDNIFEQARQCFLRCPEGLQIEYLSLPHRYPHLRNKLDVVEEDFSLIRHHAHMMSRKLEEYKWLYRTLADDSSRRVLNGIIEFWFQFDLEKLQQLAKDNSVEEQYKNISIMQKEEVIDARECILSGKPKLMILADCLSENIFDIPSFINGLRNDYKYFLRFKSDIDIWPSDYVLLAI